jgi:tRNA nucleotidyltransferase (CCA-adding enzyme)
VPVRRDPVIEPAVAWSTLRRSAVARPLVDVTGPDDDVWVVGGAVRDLLLGLVPRELDVVVTAPVDDLARRLAPVVARHERFGTVEVEPSPGVRYDIARARRERYAAPGALPDVTAVDAIEIDLERRDVTINAMALRVRDGAFVAYPGAREDLAERTLRVLHPGSFRDDPTRVWRVARYAARLGGTVESQTAAWAADADPSTISGARHGTELRLALGEPDPAAVLSTVQRLNPRFLPEGFDPDPEGVAAAVALLPRGGRRDLVRLAASCVGVSLPVLLPWLEALELTSAERTIVGAGSRASTLAPLRSARTPSEIQRAASGVPDEVVALAGGPNAERWFATIRHVRLEITGHDLQAAGIEAGPELGRRLDRALRAKLDGQLDPSVPVRAAELAAALADDDRPIR